MSLVESFSAEPFIEKLEIELNRQMEGHYDAYPTLLSPIEYLENCAVKDIKSPAMKLLIDKEEQSEVGFRLPGYIIQKDLPPIDRVSKNVAGMRQSVVISGLGLDKFEQGLKTIVAIYTFFTQSLPDGMVEPFDFKTIQGHHTLELSCHYLSTISDGNPREIDKKIDSKGLLSKAKGSRELYHNLSNVVGYYRRENEKDREVGKFSRVVLDPVLLHVGHLVEVQITFTLRPAKPRGSWYFCPTLRGIALLDTSFDKVKLQAAMEKFGNKTPPSKGIKRVGG